MLELPPPLLLLLLLLLRLSARSRRLRVLRGEWELVRLGARWCPFFLDDTGERERVFDPSVSACRPRWRSLRRRRLLRCWPLQGWGGD